jgi:Holliday junction resolvase-like predicted endonuclease
MYFPSLEGLKDSSSFVNNEIITFDALLFAIYKKGYHKRFNPRVYRYFSVEIDEKQWINFLDWLTQVKLLKKGFELCSPFSSETLNIYNRFEDIPLGETLVSPEEDEEFEVSEENIFITYSFTELLQPINSEVGGSNDIFFRKEKSKEDRTVDLPSINLSKDLTLGLQMQLYPEVIVNESLNQNKALLEVILDKVNLATNTTDKGRLFEELVEVLLSCPYLKFQSRNENYSTGEIDLVYRVNRTPTTLFENFSYVLIVECKNWDNTVGAREIRVLADKMNDYDSKVGIFASRNGISGDADFITDAKGVLRNKWQHDRKIIMSIDFNEITSIINGDESLYELLDKKYLEIRTL